MIITLTSKEGHDIKSLTKDLAFELGLRFVSKSELLEKQGIDEQASTPEDFEKIKESLQVEEKKGNFITNLDAAAWLTKADVKVLLNSLRKTRAEVLAQKQGSSLEEARALIEHREKEQARKAMQYYGIDVNDENVFDVMLNTEKLKDDDVKVMIKKFIERMKR